VKGPAGCGIAVGQGALAYLAGNLQPGTEWNWRLSQGAPPLDAPLTSDAVRDGGQRVVAGGTAAPR
jgi:hypothetical protein